ncbi:MAG: RNA-directed DNA polymerase [Acidobacteria bacterium]|nr:RNA-directed DNA polymerase [Acidobacteriota bacterium]
MDKDLREAFEIDNLRRAWKWLNTNSEALFKNYFRHIYRAYSLSAEANLADLCKRLKAESFEQMHATKLYFLKPSGTQRTFTLLCVEDQIVYQAMVNVIADRLLPRVKGRYNKEVFGNVYAGQRSKFFYADWRKGYKRFGFSLRKAHAQDFVYAASFDLTACYDSIDHKVIDHFLSDLGISQEFISRLNSYLSYWTAAHAEKRIYQGHGIPQGPLSSGLLSEVVLRFFDEQRTMKPRRWKYFRYVDDIRFLAKSEDDLRAMLVEMDLLSKQIGLFPQSSKIRIELVGDIEEYIKSVSNPPEAVTRGANPDQKKVIKRLNELSPKFKVVDETRFKYVLGSAKPNSALSNRLFRILDQQPHLYNAIFNYFSRYERMPETVSKQLLNALRGASIYDSFVASGLRAIQLKCHPAVQQGLEKFAKECLEKNSVKAELRAAAAAILLSSGRLSWKETEHYVLESDEWWERSELIRYVREDIIGKPSYESLINKLLEDEVVDVSLVAADLLAEQSLDLIAPTDTINVVAQLSLRETGYISVRRQNTCPIKKAMGHILGNSVTDIEWKSLLGKHYSNMAKKAARLRAYSESDPSAWINLLDTFHDTLLDSLFEHDPTCRGAYGLGYMGRAFDSARGAAFLGKYPESFKTFRKIHQKRLESQLSHAVAKHGPSRKLRKTKSIEFKYIEKIRPALRKAYIEIWSKW